MSKQRIFDSIEHLKYEYNLNVEIPKDIPEDCNVVCFRVSFGEGVKFSQVCKEDEHGFFRLGWGGEWEKSSESLDDALEFDKRLRSVYIYLRLTTKGNSDVFTPERLIGVKSNKGFVTAIYQYNWNNEGFVVDFDGEGQYQPSAFKYYISDDSDETVSFEEYVRMFYEE